MAFPWWGRCRRFDIVGKDSLRPAGVSTPLLSVNLFHADVTGVAPGRPSPLESCPRLPSSASRAAPGAVGRLWRITRSSSTAGECRLLATSSAALLGGYLAALWVARPARCDPAGKRWWSRWRSCVSSCGGCWACRRSLPIFPTLFHACFRLCLSWKPSAGSWSVIYTFQASLK